MTSTSTPGGKVLVHNVGGIEGCSGAAYQGVQHMADEVAKGNLNHDLGMGEDALADYANSGTGQALEGGASGWYDAERGVMIVSEVGILDDSIQEYI